MTAIAERLIAAIAASEDAIPPLHMDGRYIGPRTDQERAVLRRCAADREIVQDYIEAMTNPKCAIFAAPLRRVLVQLARGYGVTPDA